MPAPRIATAGGTTNSNANVTTGDAVADVMEIGEGLIGLVDEAALEGATHAVQRFLPTEALLRAHKKLRSQGYGVLIHDGYRPWYVTKVFWDATPPDKHEFVADPSKGSVHNRGCAVDMSLYDLRTGRAVEMPSLYDEMSERAYPTYAGGTAEQTRLRELLRKAMEAEGFAVNPSEWWHFDYKDWRQYRIGTVTFEAIGR